MDITWVLVFSKVETCHLRNYLCPISKFRFSIHSSFRFREHQPPKVLNMNLSISLCRKLSNFDWFDDGIGYNYNFKTKILFIHKFLFQHTIVEDGLSKVIWWCFSDAYTLNPHQYSWYIGTILTFDYDRLCRKGRTGNCNTLKGKEYNGQISNLNFWLGTRNIMEIRIYI